MSSIILAAIMPHLLEIISGLVLAIVGWAATRVSIWTGIQMQAEHRAALHSAVMSGIKAALGKGLTGNKAVDYALAYVQTSVPDAIHSLSPRADTLHNLAQAKLSQAKLEEAKAMHGGGDR